MPSVQEGDTLVANAGATFIRAIEEASNKANNFFFIFQILLGNNGGFVLELHCTKSVVWYIERIILI